MRTKRVAVVCKSAATHVDLKCVRALCACSRHVAPVCDRRGGQSGHRGKRAFTLLTVDHALLHFTVTVKLRPCYKVQVFSLIYFSLPLLTRRLQNVSMPRADLVQPVCQRLACWSSALPAPGVRARCACSRHVACNCGRSGQSDHCGKTALIQVGQAANCLNCFSRDFFTMARSAKQRL